MKEGITINLDFDGTLVKHNYPKVGDDIGAVPVLKKLVAKGHKLILFTMRSNDTFEGLDGIKTNTGLSDAIDWFKKNDIPLYGIQTNPTQKTWTSSPKSYAELMIDDSALGCPLKQDRVIRPMPHPNLPIPMPTGRPYVDWKKVEEMLIEKGIL